jgi:hypothetical protein
MSFPVDQDQYLTRKTAIQSLGVTRRLVAMLTRAQNLGTAVITIHLAYFELVRNIAAETPK